VGRCLLPEALHRLARVDGLGRVDADQPHPLVTAAEVHDDRVAVDHALHDGLARAERRPACPPAARRAEQRERNHHQPDPTHHCSATSTIEAAAAASS
jgi:hypothetical protein